MTSTTTKEALPLYFKTHELGTYTIAVEKGTSELDYLHLIDHLTGADIDLLATPSYTFEVKAHQYPSRFQLVFGENAMDLPDNDIVYGNCEVLDMTGRVVFRGNASQCNSTSGFAPGVYILRSQDGNEMKTQRIIIK